MAVTQVRSVTRAGIEQPTESALICRLEGVVRRRSRPISGPTSTCFEHDLRADVVAGVLSGRNLTGLARLTLGSDRVGIVAGPGSVECDAGSVSLDVHGFAIAPSGDVWPRPEITAAPGFDFPDHDYRVTGSAHVRATDPSHGYLDGSVATIEGWINLESGEVEMEAWAM